MVLPDVEAAVTAMVRRWQRELFEVQQQYRFDQVDDTMRRLEAQMVNHPKVAEGARQRLPKD